MRLRATVAALAVLVTACGGGGGSSAAPSTLTIEGAWARTTPPGAVDGVAYLTVTSPVADAIVRATVPTSVASAAELHESMADGAEGGGHHGGGGNGDGEVMVMEPLAQVPLRAGKPVTFEPGGKHIMLKGIAAPLTAGQAFTLTLTFSQAGTRDVTVTVRDDAP